MREIAGLRLVDTVTCTTVDDDDVWDAIFEIAKIDTTKLAKALTRYRFSKMLEEYKKSNPDPTEFYLQNKKEIRNNNEKRIVFLKSFLIKDEEEFYSRVKSLDEYPEEFYDERLRSDILESQNYKCGLCDRDLKSIICHLHHIDYNKQNCTKDNLIFLCPKCHGKTNSNRDFWQNLLEEKKYESKRIF